MEAVSSGKKTSFRDWNGWGSGMQSFCYFSLCRMIWFDSWLFLPVLLVTKKHAHTFISWFFFSVLCFISWFPITERWGFRSFTALCPSSQYILVSSLLTVFRQYADCNYYLLLKFIAYFYFIFLCCPVLSKLWVNGNYFCLLFYVSIIYSCLLLSLNTTSNLPDSVLPALSFLQAHLPAPTQQLSRVSSHHHQETRVWFPLLLFFAGFLVSWIPCLPFLGQVGYILHQPPEKEDRGDQFFWGFLYVHFYYHLYLQQSTR